MLKLCKLPSDSVAANDWGAAFSMDPLPQTPAIVAVQSARHQTFSHHFMSRSQQFYTSQAKYRVIPYQQGFSPLSFFLCLILEHWD